MMNREEMLARVEADLLQAKAEIQKLKESDYADRYKVYHLVNLVTYLENLFGNFKYGPRLRGKDV